MRKEETKQGSLLWRIVFGTLLIIFAFIAFGRFNATAALLYIIISVFIFIPGRVFKIRKNWIKTAIVVCAVFGVGLVNIFTGSQNIESYEIGQEFILPSNSDYSMVVTKAVREESIFINDQKYTTEGYFLLVYNKIITEKENFEINAFLALMDSNEKQYDFISEDLSTMPQFEELGEGESFYLYNLPNDATGLKISYADESLQNIIFVDLGI